MAKINYDYLQELKIDNINLSSIKINEIITILQSYDYQIIINPDDYYHSVLIYEFKKHKSFFGKDYYKKELFFSDYLVFPRDNQKFYSVLQIIKSKYEYNK